VRVLPLYLAVIGKKIPSREGWRPKAAGVGLFPTSQPTTGPDGPLPSQVGIPLRLSNLHRTVLSSVGTPVRIDEREDDDKQSSSRLNSYSLLNLPPTLYRPGTFHNPFTVVVNLVVHVHAGTNMVGDD
jgi:hypothetical protein